MIGFLTNARWYSGDALIACGKGSLAAVDTSSLELPTQGCPYGLPRIASGEAVIIAAGWVRQLRDQGVDVIGRALEPLSERFGLVIGLDDSDPFNLDFTDEEMSAMSLVLKVNGIYHDAELYNFVVGAATPDGRWTEKVEPREKSFSLSNLAKLRLSIPSFLGMSIKFRGMTRGLYGDPVWRRMGKAVGDRLYGKLARPMNVNAPPRYTTHFFGSLTHVQRAETVRMLRRSSLRWKGGITGVAPFIAGLGGAGIKTLTSAEREELRARLSKESLLTEPLGRLSYRLGMRDSKAVLSITGHGEICFRMAEAWASRRILVCQDLSHVRTLFPFEGGRNVVYCRPDLADLIDILDDIECNFPNYIAIAERGYLDWLDWSRRSEEILTRGFAPLMSYEWQYAL